MRCDVVGRLVWPGLEYYLHIVQHILIGLRSVVLEAGVVDSVERNWVIKMHIVVVFGTGMRFLGF